MNFDAPPAEAPAAGQVKEAKSGLETQLRRSLAAPAQKRFERVTRDQPPAANFYRPERSGGHEFIKSRPRQTISGRRFFHMKGPLLAGLRSGILLHFESPPSLSDPQ
jgi:hypothetical protein